MKRGITFRSTLLALYGYITSFLVSLQSTRMLQPRFLLLQLLLELSLGESVSFYFFLALT